MKYLFRLLRYKYDSEYRAMLIDAYGHNSAIDLLEKEYRELVDEYIAASHYAQGQMDCMLDDVYTHREYLAALSAVIALFEHTMEYLCDQTKYWNSHWDFFHNRPKNDPDLGEYVPL